MNPATDFEKAYFVQTRSEIDTEKKERDQMLNFAVLVLGAVGYAIAQNEAARKFLQGPEGLWFALSALCIISSLFWVRHKKLNQIALRWFVLRRITQRLYPQPQVDELLEKFVCGSLPTMTYATKDVILNIALSLPIYGLLYQQFAAAQTAHDYIRMIASPSAFVMQVIFTITVLGKPMEDPMPPLDQWNHLENPVLSGKTAANKRQHGARTLDKRS